MHLRAQKIVNIQKTWAIMFVFFLVVIGMGWFVSGYTQSPNFVYYFAGFAILMNIASFFFSDKIALKMSGAREVTYEEQPELHTAIKNLTQSAKMPMPKICVIEDAAPNAFATGRSPKKSAVVVTTGLMKMLDKNELAGVLAHELSHINNRDVLVMTVAVVLVGFLSMLADMFWYSNLFGSNDSGDRGGVVGMLIGVGIMILAPLAGTLMKLAVSRKREFVADASGAEMTHNPEGLASALEKIERAGLHMKKANHATAHLFIANPFGSSGSTTGRGGSSKRGKLNNLGKFFSTHPPTHERVNALRGRRM